MTKLPPWTGDDPAMLEWLVDIINAELKKVNEREGNNADDEPDVSEIAAARLLRDIAPLRAKYPHLADFLHLPPSRSRRTNRQARLRAVMDGYGAALDFDDAKHRAIAAAYLVPMIRNIWKAHFDGKFYRKRGDKSAEWFAAACLDVEEAAVKRAIHRLKSTPARSDVAG